MLNRINLSLLRKLVQLGMFLFLVYGSTIVGFYATDKVSNALPALACTYDLQTADHCVLVPFQHRMDHRLGQALVGSRDLMAAVTGLAVTFATFLLFFVVLNKAFCGWICPLGFFQEILSLIGQKLGLRRIESLPEGLVKRIRPWKWVLLLALVFGLPLLTGMGVVGHELGNPFCSICPSRILTTVTTGDTSQVYLDSSSTGYFILSLIANLLFGLMVAWGLFVRQPFCRICPMLALHAVFRKIGLVRLVKNGTSRCGRCGLCAKACPMDIREIHTEMDKKDVMFADCTLCGRCVEFCPDKDVLQLKYAVIPLLRADPAYFKKRKKAQGNWEKANLLTWWRKRHEEGDV